MKFISKFGFIALSLTLCACSTKQAPPPPPLTLVTKAVPPPEPEPAPLTGAQLLAQQPQEVQEAVKKHQKDGAWQVYNTPRRELYPYDEGVNAGAKVHHLPEEKCITYRQGRG